MASWTRCGENIQSHPLLSGGPICFLFITQDVSCWLFCSVKYASFVYVCFIVSVKNLVVGASCGIVMDWVR